MTSLLAHEVQADAGHTQAQDATGSAEKSTKPQPQLMLYFTGVQCRRVMSDDRLYMNMIGYMYISYMAYYMVEIPGSAPAEDSERRGERAAK
jgi:hypothetical protein